MKMYDNILRKVDEYEYKRGITYAKPEGKLYKYTKVLYVLVFIYAMLMNLFFVLGISMSDTLKQQMEAPLYSVLILMVVLIGSIILTKFKQKIIPAIASFVLNALSCTGLILVFAPLMERPEGGFKAPFFWRHLIPLCVLFLLNLIINVILIRAGLKKRKTYKKIVDNAYAMHHTSIEDGSLDEDKWEEVLKNI